MYSYVSLPEGNHITVFVSLDSKVPKYHLSKAPAGWASPTTEDPLELIDCPSHWYFPRPSNVAAIEHRKLSGHLTCAKGREFSEMIPG